MSIAFQRARRPEQKLQRAEAILDAARSLGLERGVRSVSLTDIAGAVGIHKSAILRYFETREEVYLQLTAEGWRDWADALVAELASAHGVDAVASAFSTTLTKRPLFCELLAHAPLILERNVSVASVRSFKVVALDAVERIATAVAIAAPPLRTADGRELVAAVTAIAASLWQISHPAPAVAELFLTDPEMAHAVVDFTPRLERLTRAQLLGLEALSR